jgi:glycosyltransferase involved in cell wall biosynthesis
MRLLYLSADPGVPVFGPKGASVHVRSMAGALDTLGQDVLIASPGVQLDANSLPAGVRCSEIPAVNAQDRMSSAEVLDQARVQADAVIGLARREGAEAIYERYSLASFAGARTAAALGVPLVLEVNAPLRIEAQRFRQLFHEDFAIQAEAETFSAAQKIFVVSRALARWLSETGVEGRRIEIMGNAPPARAFGDRHPIPEGAEVIVGFAGGLKPWHGIETLLRGFELALGQGARMRLEILGEGPADALLDRASLSPDRLLRHGHLPHRQALDVLARWDVGVAVFDALPGFYFSPLKLFEYMAAGLCAVVSEVGELAEIVEHGRAGVVVAPGRPEALAEALLALDRSRGEIRELGTRAQALARTGPTWIDNARRVLSAIDDASAPALLAQKGTI